MIIVSPFILKLLTGNFATGIAFWPLIIVRYESSKNDPVLINHESIHLRQQLEMLIIFFYLWYMFEYLYYRLKGLNGRAAYRNISFEREAFRFENDLDYLRKRKNYNWLKLKY